MVFLIVIEGEENIYSGRERERERSIKSIQKFAREVANEREYVCDE